MRIGIDCRLWAENTGRYVRNLVEELAQLDTQNEYVLFCLSKDEESIKEASHIRSKDNWKTVRADIHWHSVAEQIQFPRILNRENLDLVHFPYFSVPILYTKPYVMTMHDLTVSKISTGRASTLPAPVFYTKRIAYKLIVRQALKNACKIIVPTNSVKKELIEENIRANKIEVTYEGASLQIRNPKSETRNKFKNSKNQNEAINHQSSIINSHYFLYVGNAYPHKNLERLTEAFSLFCSKYQVASIKLVFVGKEDYFYKRLKEELKQKGRDQNIIFTDFVTDAELVQLYKHAQAVFVPSLAEGFGLPAVEAMSCGALVAASDIPVLAEVCGDAALYFDPYKIASISDIMTKISSFSKKDYEIYKKRAEQQSKKFSWKKMAEQTLAIYKSCVGV